MMIGAVKYTHTHKDISYVGEADDKRRELNFTDNNVMWG